MRVRLCFLIVFLASFALLQPALSQGDIASVQRTTQAETAVEAVPGDRWMEIDLYWFKSADIPGSAKQFWDRFQPLYSGVQGDRGIILNVGWTVGYIMEWSGDLSQSITLPSGTGQEPWVPETSPLAGTTEDRQRAWKERFAGPVVISRQGYGSWTYSDLRSLCEAIRQEAVRRGIEHFKVGSLVFAWDNAYKEIAPWAKRHPEAFTQPVIGKNVAFNPAFFDPAAKLHRDTAKLGSMPAGIREGTLAHAAFASQWGSLSKVVGLDAIMLRDSFGMPVPYRRAGPWGGVAPSADLIKKATQSVSALVRETKTANQSALVMMYSNAASAMSDWRSNGLDLEQIAKEGFLDIYVDQTWAGAWNEVGVRHNSFWNLPTLGWTYQLTSTLMHGAMLSGTKVRHYPLVETFDAWESWDVLHTVPNRLRWGIWAYSHASVNTPNGIEVPAGSYISWANQGKNLLSPADVDFLKTNIGAAVIDAHKTSQVYGPVLVYARSSAQWQAMHAKPAADVKEWLDEQAGSAIKWPVPILSATRIEWLPKIKADMFVFGAPSHLLPQELTAITDLVNDRKPVAIFGSTAGGVDPQLQKMAGIHFVTTSKTAPSIRSGSIDASNYGLVANSSRQFPVKQSFNRNLLSEGATGIYSVDGSPALTLSRKPAKLLLWDPPDFEDSWDVSLKETWGGSGAPYALVAGAMTALLGEANALHATHIDLEQTANISAWSTTDGTLHILMGNLEEGLRDDADMRRTTTLQFPSLWKKYMWNSVWSSKDSETASHIDSGSIASDGKLKVQLAPAGSLLLEGHGAR